jgi:hypothetical protein
MLEFEGILRRNRALQELLQLARNVVDDGVITNKEAEEFRHWVETNPDISGVWPVGIVTRAMKRAFADGELTEGDRRELLELLWRTLRAKAQERGPRSGASSTERTSRGRRSKLTRWDA